MFLYFLLTSLHDLEDQYDYVGPNHKCSWSLTIVTRDGPNPKVELIRRWTLVCVLALDDHYVHRLFDITIEDQLLDQFLHDMN